MENQLFSWNGWDGDMECMIFYNPILKVQIGKHTAGTKFDSAVVMFDKGILQFTNFGPMVDNYAPVSYEAEYNLKLSVADTIKE